MSGRRTESRPRRSSLSAAVCHATVHVRSDGTYHRSVTEQITLDLDIPAATPILVVTLDETETFNGSSVTRQVPLAQLSETLAQVLEFHVAFDLPREALPSSHVGDSIAQLRVRLLREEVEEFAEAAYRRDLVAIADALADVVYVAYGSAVTYGIDLDAVVREVHRANMSKLDADGRPVLRDDGKVLKSERYRPPEVGRVIEDQLPLFDPDGTHTEHGSATVG